jgi:hypothetical protein
MIVLNQARPETPLSVARSVGCRHHIPNRDLVGVWILTVQISFPFARHDPTIETL